MKPSCAATKLTDAIGPRSRRAEQVLRAGQPGAELAQPARLTAHDAGDVGSQKVPHGVAVPVVPLGERRRELPGAPPVEADVPRLGDQLDPRRAPGRRAMATRNGWSGS